MKTVLLLAALIAAAAAAAAAPRRKRPAARAEKAKKAPARPAAPAPAAEAPAAAAAAPAPAPAPAAGKRDDATLGAFGAALDQDADGLLAAEPYPGRAADAAGLRAGDRVWYADRAAARTRAEAAAARRAAAPEMRESLIVRRGLETKALSGPESPVPPDFVRGSADLSAREKSLAAARDARESARARDAVLEAAPFDWSLRADQAFWVRFPKGLPAGLAKGDVVEAEVSTGLTSDGSLDFLAVPPQSRAWARVLAAADDGAVRAARLAFFKLQPAGGRVYPILGAVTAAAGVAAADLVRVSGGGTLVVAAPIPSADGKKTSGKNLLLDENARLRVRLLEPATLSEAPSWWRAGPGLWLKTDADPSGKRRFQVTHVVAGRAAAAAGLKVGDELDAVGGKPSDRIDFEEALDALYGAPGSTVKVSVLRPGGSKTVELARGVKLDAKGAPAPLPLPFETR